jgi:hypothetical protein
MKHPFLKSIFLAMIFAFAAHSAHAAAPGLLGDQLPTKTNVASGDFVFGVDMTANRTVKYPASVVAGGADVSSKLDKTNGTATGLTFTGTNLVTARGSTTARGLEDRFSDEINVLDHGFVDDGATDNSSVANTLFQSSTVDKKRVIFPRSRNGTGVYLFNSTVTVTKDIYPEGAPGVKAKRGDLATGYTFAFTVPQTMGFNLIFDGNKANNSLSVNRSPLIKYYAAHHGVLLQGYFTNHVVGIYDTDSRYGWSAKNLNFYNVAEHEGTYTNSGWHLSCAVNISHVNLTNSAAHFSFENTEIINDSAPSTTGKAGGGIIWGGSLANNARPRVSVNGFKSVNIGQSYPRTGDPNHIAALHAYEASEYDTIANATGISNKFGFIHLQNTRYPTVYNISVEGMDPGIAESEGTGALVVGVDRTLGDGAVDYGFLTASKVRVRNVGVTDAIRIYGRSTAADDQWQGGDLSGLDIDNAEGRALKIVNANGVFNVRGTLKGKGVDASSGAVEIQNFDGHAFISADIDPYDFNGLYASSGFAGSLSLEGGKIYNGESGTTAFVATIAGNLSVKGVTFDAPGGNAFTIAGANSLYWFGNNTIDGSRNFTFSNIGNVEGWIYAPGNPNTNGLMAVAGRLIVTRSDNPSTNQMMYYKATDSGGSASTNGFALLSVDGHTHTGGDLSLVSQAQGDIMYYNGSTWVVLPAGTSGRFLQTQGAGANPAWAAVVGTGDVVGPSSSTNNNLAAFDSTTGKLIKDSKIATDGNGAISTAGTITASRFIGNGAVADSNLELPDNDGTHFFTIEAAGTTTTSVNLIGPAAPFSGIAKYTASGATNFTMSQATVGTDYVGPPTQTGTHASPTTSNPLAPTWTGDIHTVWSGATHEIDLPAAAGYTGRGILIYNTGAFTITIDPNASEVIVRDGTVQTGGVTFTLSSGAGNYVALISDGTRWITIGYKGTLAVGS